jgi:hypothetical protein
MHVCSLFGRVTAVLATVSLNGIQEVEGALEREANNPDLQPLTPLDVIGSTFDIPVNSNLL